MQSEAAILDQTKGELHITIGAAPQAIGPEASVSLQSEIRLLKPALLYGDRVTLLSPTASFLVLLSEFPSLKKDERIGVIRQVGPIIDPENAETVNSQLTLMEELRKKKHRTPRELVVVMQFERMLDDAWKKVGIEVDRILESAGAGEIRKAIAAGLLQVSPIGRRANVDVDALLTEFVGKLFKLVSEQSAYPLFDEGAEAMIRAGAAAGLLDPAKSVRNRGKQVSVASEFLNRLPAFPRASVGEILDIRKDLKVPLVRFRSAMVEMGRLISSAPYEDEFPIEVQDLYMSHMAPALLEIEETVRKNRYLRTLLGEVLSDPKTLLADVIALGAATFTDLPALIVGSAAVAAHLVHAAWKTSEKAQQIRQHQLFLLYKTNILLEETAKSSSSLHPT